MLYIKFDIISLIISILIALIVNYGLSSYSENKLKNYKNF